MRFNYIFGKMQFVFWQQLKINCNGKTLLNYNNNSHLRFSEATQKSLEMLALLSNAVKTEI